MKQNSKALNWVWLSLCFPPACERLIAILEEGAPDDHHHEVLQPVLQAGGSVRAPASGKGAVDDVD